MLSHLKDSPHAAWDLWLPKTVSPTAVGRTMDVTFHKIFPSLKMEIVFLHPGKKEMFLEPNLTSQGSLAPI